MDLAILLQAMDKTIVQTVPFRLGGAGKYMDTYIHFVRTLVIV